MTKPTDDAYSLPDVAERYIRKVATRIGNTRRVRREVYQELADSFTDALADCDTADERRLAAEELIAQFGNAKLLAKLIRRAKRRCGPLRQSPWLCAAITCGALPLLFGVGVFLAWLPTRYDFLELAGALTLVAGPFVVAAGAILLGIHIWRSQRKGKTRHLIRRSIAVGFLLLLNFPFAICVFEAAIHLETRYELTVLNCSAMTIEAFEVSGGGVNVSFGPVEPGQERREFFWIRHDGELKYEAWQGQTRLAGTVEGYVTNGKGGETEIIVRDNGEVEVSLEAD